MYALSTEDDDDQRAEIQDDVQREREEPGPSVLT